MPDENEDPKSQTWPFWWWPRWMTDALSSSGSALAPQLLNQPILPGSTFGNVITVTETNSSSPEMERDIVAKESYGRQLGPGNRCSGGANSRASKEGAEKCCSR